MEAGVISYNAFVSSQPLFFKLVSTYSVFLHMKKNLTFLAMKKTGIELLNLKVSRALPV